ncbi:MAG: VCBS repeat-containing protein [Candidatus Didemnitutus sp.]|nr:VCBS repeat-containing protein [Candidatus Didemnitutus sp.]
MLFRRLPSLWIAALLGVSAVAAALAQPALSNGEPLRVGAADGRGALAVGLSSRPVGVARVSGATEPDLFVIAGRFSHPAGLFLLPWRSESADGTPVFGAPRKIPTEQAKELPTAAVTMLELDSTLYLLVAGAHEVQVQRFAPKEHRFVAHSRIRLAGLPRAPSSLLALPNADGSVDLLMAISDGAPYRPKSPDWRDPAYVPFDGSGRWTGGYPYLAFYAVRCARGLAEGATENFRRISASEREILLRGGALTRLPAAKDEPAGFVAGTWFGDLLFYRNEAADGLRFSPRRWLRDDNGEVLRHPTCGGDLVAYPRADGRGFGLIVGGEGALYFYRSTGLRDTGGAPTFRPPVPLLQENAELYAGSLPVPNLVDWDRDGLTDLVVGNSEGRLLLFRNEGTPRAPAFAAPVALRANGGEIHVQPGARGSIQGPAEARWGYLSPTAVDWNGDGAPEMVASSATARHVLWSRQRDTVHLRAEQSLLLDGLELRGTWRCRPGAGLLDGRMAYIALDDDDCLHLYWRMDDRHLADGGRLLLEDGRAISANFLSAGGTGRTKILLTDWDGDGVKDLLLGTPRHGSVPEPKRGLPQALGLPGAAVLFLRNVGNEQEPKFARPAVLTHDGQPLYFGQHECAPSVGVLAGEPCLIVGREDGRLIYFSRSRLGLFTPERD